jgi:uncharacterized protein
VSERQTPLEGGGDEPWRVPWGGSDALGVLGLTAILAVGLTVAVLRLTPAEQLTGPVRTALAALPLTLLGLVTIAWVHVRHRSVRQLFGPEPSRARDWIAGARWGVGAFLLFNVIISLTLQLVARLVGAELPQPQEAIRHMAADPVTVPWLLVTAAFVAPVAEELYFRGMLFQALRRTLPAGWGIVTSALLFAGAHVLAEPTGAAGLLVFVLILPLGMLLAWLLERRGTLTTPIVAHATFNLMTMMVLIAGGSGLIGGG